MAENLLTMRDFVPPSGCGSAPICSEERKTMRLRDEHTSAYASIFILRGLTPEVLTAIPDAFHRIITADDARMMRRRWKGSPGRRSHLTIAQAANATCANVHHVDATLSDSELFGVHHRLGFDRLPANLIVSGDRLSIKTWHVDFDGAGTLAFMHRLIDLACGLPDTRFPRPVRLPVLRGAIRAAAPVAIWEAIQFRRDHITPVQPARQPTEAQHLRNDVHLDAAELDETLVDQLRQATDRGTTVNSALISAVAQTAAEIYRGSGDPVVLIPVHQGKWVGGHVVGNFVLNHRLGGLCSTVWHPRAVRDSLAEAQTRAGFGGFLWDLLSPLKARIRRRRPEAAAQPELTVQISAIRSPRPFPTRAWTTGRPRALFGSTGPYPAFFTLLWRVGDAVVLAFEDETDDFDSRRYTEVLERKLADLLDAQDVPTLHADAGPAA